jgi:ketosteroid isomerase-like protein
VDSPSAQTVDQIRTRNRATLMSYLGRSEDGPAVDNTSQDARGLYASSDHWGQNPFAPDGQFKAMKTDEHWRTMFEWGEKTMPHPFMYTVVLYHETEDPKVFWVEDDGLGMVTWRGGFVYANRHMWKIQFNDEGRVCFETEYFSPIAKFRIDLTELPQWDYNAERLRIGLEPVVLPRKGRTHTYPLLIEPAKQAVPDDEAARRIRAAVERFKVADRFVEGSYDAAGRWVPDPEVVECLADDFVYELPWTPDGMLKMYDADERLAFSQFLAKSVADVRIIKKYFWATTDPTVFIFEDEREATVTWRGGGTYRNRHIGVLRFNSDGKLMRWCEYFDPAQMFTMDATKWPEWDYNETRAEVGLDPVPLTWEETHGLLPLP